MKRTLLIFPNNSYLTDFVLQQDVLDVEINAKACSLLVELTDEQIEVACTRFQATQILLGQSPDSPTFPETILK